MIDDEEPLKSGEFLPIKHGPPDNRKILAGKDVRQIFIESWRIR